MKYTCDQIAALIFHVSFLIFPQKAEIIDAYKQASCLPIKTRKFRICIALKRKPIHRGVSGKKPIWLFLSRDGSSLWPTFSENHRISFVGKAFKNIECNCSPTVLLLYSKTSSQDYEKQSMESTFGEQTRIRDVRDENPSIRLCLKIILSEV